MIAFTVFISRLKISHLPSAVPASPISHLLLVLLSSTDAPSAKPMHHQHSSNISTAMLRARGKQRNELSTSTSSNLPSKSLLRVDELQDVEDEQDRQYSDRSSSTGRRLRRRPALASHWRRRITGQTGSSYGSNFGSNATTLSPFLLIIGCLCFAVAFEVGYILAIGAFSGGEIRAFFLGPAATKDDGTTTHITTNDKSTYTKLRVQGNVPPPIDNYYSRPHIRDPVPLVVGGSDGSGTRAFVQILEHLNVPILVEDRGTMDVHGSEMYDGAGWPALVSRILNATHSAYYDLDEIPDPIHQSAKTEVGKFLKSVKIAGRAMVDVGFDKTWATSVSWAFKAPASILLLPFFREQLPALKVLHIVRDGRDVALSENHSPVRKFYTDFYPDAEARHKALLEYDEFGKDQRTNVKAMQLWNDWNHQVYDYGVRHSDGKTLDVLVMRTEDLLQYPLESIALLADFVGSLKSSQQLCCLSQMSANDLGQSGPSNPLDELVEAGEEEGVGGLRGRIMYDPDDFAQIRKRFKEFVSEKDEKKVGGAEPGQKKNAIGRRRLIEEPIENDDKIDVFKSGGRIASANHPGNDLNINAAAVQRHDISGIVAPGFNQVARMQQLLREKRAMVQRVSGTAHDQEDVKLRYGKWVQALSEDPALSSQLHKYGRESLSLFGYEPPREFMDIHPHPELLSTCDYSAVCRS